MRRDAVRVKPFATRSIFLSGLLFVQPALSQSGIERSESPQRLSEEELDAHIKRLQDNFRQEVKKAHDGECTPGFTSVRYPTDRYCQTDYDPEFVIQAIETRSPTPDVWSRFNELTYKFPGKTHAGRRVACLRRIHAAELAARLSGCL